MLRWQSLSFQFVRRGECERFGGPHRKRAHYPHFVHIKARSSGRPSQLPATKQVGMHMLDRLGGIRAGVENYPEASIKALSLGDLGCGGEQFGREVVVGLCQGSYVWVVCPGYS